MSEVPSQLHTERLILRRPRVTDAEAILNLKNAILDLFDELTEAAPETLGKLPQMWSRILDKIITRV